MRRVSIITPTCFRPQLFREMCESLKQTTKDYDIEHIVVIDRDLKTSSIAEEYGALVDFSPIRRGALWCWNRGLRLSTAGIIVPGGDDHLYHEGWLDYALESHVRQLDGYGVVGMNDLAYSEQQVATMWLFDRRYCKEVMGGVFAPPMYKYLCVDLEWNEKAKMTGHYYRDMRAIVEHRHSAHGKRELDRHDKWKIDNALSDLDGKIYDERKAAGFPITWEPLI